MQRLLESLNRLVDAGHTVLLIEHHLDVIKLLPTLVITQNDVDHLVNALDQVMAAAHRGAQTLPCDRTRGQMRRRPGEGTLSGDAGAPPLRRLQPGEEDPR